MTETKSAAAENGLFAALAQLQAQMPVVGKDQEGEVKGEKNGRQYAWKYKYADLTTISSVLLPLMGKLGLAFTAKPTVNAAGHFVLAYKLVHGPSGESDEGEYLLPSPERVEPQKLGSFITYARRYTLCCVTGCAPGGDDDDAQTAQQTAADAWESATPAASRAPASAANDIPDSPPQPDLTAPVDPDALVDEDAQEIADQAHEARTVRAVADCHARAHDAGKLSAVVRSPASGGKGYLGRYLAWRRNTVASEVRALADLNAAGEAAGLAGDALDARVQKITGASIEEATVAQMKEATAALASAGAPA